MRVEIKRQDFINQKDVSKIAANSFYAQAGSRWG